MTWQKQGRIFNTQNLSSWQQHSFMTPTPWLKDEETIRLYGGFRDSQGCSRIGYLDVAASNPADILHISQRPVIDIGAPGMFDDRGMILGDLVPDPGVDKRLRMYYIGFQHVEQAKFYAFTGCAFSDDNGESFTRYGMVPIMDRSDEGPFISAIHSILYRNGLWHCWYSTGDGWQQIDDVQYPRYRIRYATSNDGLHFPVSGHLCLDVSKSEYRIGRPRVMIDPPHLPDVKFLMYYTSDTTDKQYNSGAAISDNGTAWARSQLPLSGLTRSKKGWDSEMACYPVQLDTKYGSYLFYSGNDMGRDGIGFAKWMPDS